MIIARVGPHDATIEVPHRGSLRLDCVGRWCSVRFDDTFYRRLLAGGAAELRSRTAVPVDVADPGALHVRVADLAAELVERLSDVSTPIQLSGNRDDLLTYLQRAAALTPASWKDETGRFAATYPEHVEILPPDRYRDVVVLPATGCPNRECTFCAFYRDRPLRVLAPDEFSQHLESVAALFGPALGTRTGVFLGSASALSLSQSKVLHALHESQRVFGVTARGAAAFWDPDHCPARTPEDWQVLAEAGLRWAYLGLETGLPDLREQTHKSGDLPKLVEQVRDLRQGGVLAGVIVLAGLGGAARSLAHGEATAAVVEAMGLGPRERVFVSALEGEMSGPELHAESVRLRGLLASRTEAQVVSYALKAFRYYA